jgi:enoyl-CoA hydratase/carnithine racemase
VITREDRGGVAVVTMADGENLVDASFVDALHAQLDAIEADESCRAVVLTGSGKFFSNGFDLAYLGSLDLDGLQAFVGDAQRLVARVLTLPLATIAAVNGHAFGISAMLALAHDHRLVRADRGWWCLPEVDLGLPLQPFMVALLRARLSDLSASEAVLTGRRYDGDSAVAAGIAHGAVADAELLDRAVEIAATRGSKRRDILGTLKRDMYAPVVAALE